MRDDDDRDGRANTVSTVPPPPGETDVYEARTQVGGLSPEALAMLRGIRDESPQTGQSRADVHVPVFEDDAPTPSERSPAPPAPTVIIEEPPKAEPVFTIPRPPLTPVGLVPPPSPFDGLKNVDASDAEPLSYASVFGPMAGEGSEPTAIDATGRGASSSATPWLRILLILAVFVALAAVALALLGVFPDSSLPLPKSP